MEALTDGCEDFGASGLDHERARRNEAFRQVRTHPARTERGYLAKLGVLVAVRNWFGPDDPEVRDFAFEVALEAGALFEKGGEGNCPCKSRHEESASRRSRFSWVVRPKFHSRGTPFAG
jgi:hypothetical protein